MLRQAAMSGSPEISVAAVAALTGMAEHRAFTVLESLATFTSSRPACSAATSMTRS
jgi:hypothetical protein